MQQLPRKWSKATITLSSSKTFIFKKLETPHNFIPFFFKLASTVVFLLIFLTANLPVVESNNLALLAGTLKTFQRHACQGTILPLQCPMNSTIDILYANYGGAHPPLCPSIPGRKQVSSDNDQRGRCDYSVATNFKMIGIVVRRCHRKRNCTIVVPSPHELSKDDPCPHINKYIEVAFKCRPDTFINKVICEEKELALDCGKQSRIAIYNAMFGRTKQGSILCPQFAGLPEDDCLATFATNTVMNACHGQPNCQLKASASIFGRPCPPEYLMYLKVVYTCVPSWILKSEVTKKLLRFGPTETRFNSSVVVNKKYDGAYPKSNQNSHNSGLSRSTMSTSDILNCTVAILAGSRGRDVGIITEWMKTIAFLNKNFEKFTLYMVLGIIIGILSFVIVIAIRLMRRQQKDSHKNDRDIGNFIGAIDDVDADLDIVSSSPSNGGEYSSPGALSTSLMEPSTSRSHPSTSSQAPTGRNTDSRTMSSRPSRHPENRHGASCRDAELTTPRSLSQSNNNNNFYN